LIASDRKIGTVPTEEGKGTAIKVGVNDIVKNIEVHKKKSRSKSLLVRRASRTLKSMITSKSSDYNDIGLDDAVPTYDASKVKKKDKEKFLRMRARANKVPCLLYPED